MEEQIRQREAQMELNRREMYRKSLDTIRIYNPLDHTFRYMYDGFWHQVPAGGTKDEPRYLARHYFKKIAEYMIGQQILKDGEELLKLREKQLGKAFLDKYEENKEVWDKTPRLDDEKLLKEIRDVVILGVVEEYGLDLPEEVPAERRANLDFKPLNDQIFDEVDRPVFDEVEKEVVDTPVEEKKYPINKKKDL